MVAGGCHGAYQQRLHPRHDENDPIEPHELKERKPWVESGLSNDGDLDDRADDGEEGVQPIVPMLKKRTPIRQCRQNPDHDFEVESDGDEEFPIDEEQLVVLRHVNGLRGLEREGGEGHENPDPFRVCIEPLGDVRSVYFASLLQIPAIRGFILSQWESDTRSVSARVRVRKGRTGLHQMRSSWFRHGSQRNCL